MEEDNSCLEGEYLVRCSARAEEVRDGKGFPYGRQERLCRCLPLPIIFEYPTVHKPCKAFEHTLTFSSV